MNTTPIKRAILFIYLSLQRYFFFFFYNMVDPGCLFFSTYFITLECLTNRMYSIPFLIGRVQGGCFCLKANELFIC